MAQAGAFALVALSSLVKTGVSYLFPSDGPRMKDLEVSASTYGNMIPRVFGTMRVGGNMVWSLPIEERKKKKRAGKGGSYYNEYTYWANFAMAFAQGPVTSIRRIWADGKLIYDSTGTATIDAGRFTMRIYRGTENQLPDPLVIEGSEEKINSFLNPIFDSQDYVPGLRDLCYVVFEDFLLADFGNRIPQMAAEVYVGPNGAPEVLDADFTSNLPSAITSNSIQLGALAVDYDRGYYYAETAGSVAGVDGIRRLRLDDGVQDRFITLDAMNLTPRPSTGLGGRDGIIDRITLLCAGPDGRVYITGGPSNYSPLYMLDPVSYTDVAQYGFEGPFSGGGPDPVPWGDQGAVATGTNGAQHFCHVSQTESILIFDVTSYDFDLLAGYDLPLKGNLVTDFIAPSRPGRGEPEFWIAQDENFHEIYLVRASATSVQTVHVENMGVPGETCRVTNIFFDAGSNGVIVACVNNDTGNRRLFKWSIDADAVVWRMDDLPSLSIFGPYGADARIENNELAVIDNTFLDERIYLIDTLAGTFIDRDADIYFTLDEDYRPDPLSLNDGGDGYQIDLSGASDPNAPTAGDMTIYDSRRQILVGIGGSIVGGVSRHVFVGSFGNADTNLGDILRQMFFDAGLTSSDFDVSDLESVPVKGFGFAREVDVKSVIQELQSIYLFDLAESDGRLVGSLRGSTITDQTIDARLLGSNDPERSAYWEETRSGEIDLPAQITFKYMNIDDDYESSSSLAKRISSPVPTMESKQQITVEASVVMTPDEAKNQVHKMLYAQWGERIEHQTRWPWALAELDPGDLITVNFPDGRSYFDRIQEIEVGADRIGSARTASQDSGAYQSDLTADGGGSGRNQVIVPPQPAVPFVLNTPLLRDVDAQGQDYSTYYAGVGNAGSKAFRGATMLRSLNSTDYEDLFQEADDVEYGSVIGVLPPPPHGVFSLDWESRLRIAPAVDWFDLESITDDQLWNGLNAAVVGDEVIQFRDAEENSDGTWTVWNLLRGRRGTEYAAFNHGSGENFIFLDQNTVNIEADALNAHGQDRWFKAVGSGRSVVETPALQIGYWARDLMPYAPSDIRRDIDGGSGDITLTWARRTRLGGNLQDGTGSVPLNETEERYEVYILDAPFNGDLSTPVLPDNIVRSYEVTVPTATYSASDQTADSFDRNVDTLHVVVYQLSGAVGRGFPGARSIAHWDDF